MLDGPTTLAPRTSTTGRISGRRTVAFATTPLDEVKQIKRHFGVSVNDVVMAIVAGGVRTWLEAQGELPDAPLAAMVPISVRDDGAGAFGNRIAMMIPPVFSEEPDPVVRLPGYMLNWGSWSKSFPGWMSFARPGRMAAEPVLFTQPAYVYYLFDLTVIGCLVMRTVAQRWGAGLFVRVAVCWLALALCALVAEGLIYFPLGLLTYPGGVGPRLFPSTYHFFPLHEAVFIGAVTTAFALVRHQVNDRGETIAERGLSRLNRVPGRVAMVRFLAVAGVANLLFFGLYNVPVALIVAHGSTWPRDEQQRSYFTNWLCGAGTDRLCPDHGCRCGVAMGSTSTPPDRSSFLAACIYLARFRLESNQALQRG